MLATDPKPPDSLGGGVLFRTVFNLHDLVFVLGDTSPSDP